MREFEIENNYKNLIDTVVNKEDLIDMLQFLFIENDEESKSIETIDIDDLDSLFED